MASLNVAGHRATPAWYALRTRSRHEKKVRDELDRKTIATFLPLYARWSRWKDRRKRIEAPLFPGYCFARFTTAERLAVLTTRGVVGIVSTNRSAEPVPEAEIEGIRRLIASRLQYDPHPFLVEGMEVEVTRGPLAGVRGRLVRKDRAARLVIGVTLLHQGATLHIHPADVIGVDRKGT